MRLSIKVKLLAVIIILIIAVIVATVLVFFVFDVTKQNSITSSPISPTTTRPKFEDDIIQDLNQLTDSIKKFKDDLTNLINENTTFKIFREEVEHYKTTTNNPFYGELILQT